MEVEYLLWVPTAFQVLHQGIDLVAIEQLDELAAQASVAMFTAQRAFVFLDQQSRLIGHFAKFAFAFCVFDIDDGSQVQLTRADVGMIDSSERVLKRNQTNLSSTKSIQKSKKRPSRPPLSP